MEGRSECGVSEDGTVGRGCAGAASDVCVGLVAAAVVEETGEAEV